MSKNDQSPQVARGKEPMLSQNEKKEVEKDFCKIRKETFYYILIKYIYGN